MIGVAVIENSYHYRSALINLLESTEILHSKGVYSSAEEAWPNLILHQPDIVIIDLSLPKMSAITLISTIRNETPKTQFLIYTPTHNNDLIFEALKAGASGYILKDTTPDAIRNTINELFMGGVQLSPIIAHKLIKLLHQKRRDINSYGLTDREMEVLKLMSEGLLYKEIAERLFIAVNTVKNHLKSIYKKLHVQNKIEAINKYKSQ